MADLIDVFRAGDMNGDYVAQADVDGEDLLIEGRFNAEGLAERLHQWAEHARLDADQ